MNSAIDVEIGGATSAASAIGEFPEPAEGWSLTTLGEIAGFVQYGTSVRADAGPEGVPMLRMGNIQDGCIDLTHLKFVDRRAANISSFLLRTGDILFNRTNSPE